MSTTAICSMVFTRLRIWSAVAPAKVSAQSPPWRRNASPREAAASRVRSMSTSPANTSGGSVASSADAACAASASGHCGCCLIGSVRQ